MAFFFDIFDKYLYSFSDFSSQNNQNDRRSQFFFGISFHVQRIEQKNKNEFHRLRMKLLIQIRFCLQKNIDLFNINLI